jgi:hypothetical protein
LVAQADLEQSGTLLAAAVWFYASIWSIAATLFALNGAPKVPTWPLLPLQAVLDEIRLTRTYVSRISIPSLTSLLSGIAILLALLAGMALIGVLNDLIPSIVWRVIRVCALALILLAVLVSGGTWVWFWAQDRSRRHRCLGPDRTNMTVSELFTCLASMEMAASATWVLREVRSRRLLHEDSTAALAVRDLLQVVEHPWGRRVEGKGCKSPVFAAWVQDGGGRDLLRLSRLGHTFHDELGSLLEELERRDELPFA